MNTKSSVKKSGYRINYITNSVIVTRKFLEEASTLGPAADIMNQLRALGFTIVVKAPEKRKSSRLTYAKMENFIECVENSEDYMSEFEMVKALSKSQSNPYIYVKTWFLNNFPNYSEQPVFDEDGFVVVKAKSRTEAEAIKVVA